MAAAISALPPPTAPRSTGSSNWRSTPRALPGEGDPIFTPAEGAYPGGACFAHERVETGGGWFLGWLSARIC
jgi:hypothetical protein